MALGRYRRGFWRQSEWKQPSVIRTMCMMETSGWHAWASSSLVLCVAEDAHCRECPKRFACNSVVTFQERKSVD